MKWITEVMADNARRKQKEFIDNLYKSLKPNGVEVTDNKMTTRAKLVCQKVDDKEHDGVKNAEWVSFMTQYNSEDSPEDNIYSKFTPSAQFNFSITNPDLFGQFTPGKAYYFDITPVD